MYSRVSCLYDAAVYFCNHVSFCLPGRSAMLSFPFFLSLLFLFCFRSLVSQGRVAAERKDELHLNTFSHITDGVNYITRQVRNQ